MPYSKEHKRQTRARIVECARQLFNRHGFAEVSIDDIMRSAGLTRGGFYNHFDSKEDLYSEVLDAFACKARAATEGESGVLPGPEDLARAHRFIDSYVSHTLAEEPEQHCPLIALPSDVARSGPTVRAAYENVFTIMAAMLETAARYKGGERHRQLSLALASACVGAMVLARTVDDRDLAREICDAAKALAHATLDTETPA